MTVLEIVLSIALGVAGITAVAGWGIAIGGAKINFNQEQSTLVYVVNVNQNYNGNMNLANVKYYISNANFQSKLIQGTNVYIPTIQERLTNYVEMCEMISNIISTNYSRLLLGSKNP